MQEYERAGAQAPPDRVPVPTVYIFLVLRGMSSNTNRPADVLPVWFYFQPSRSDGPAASASCQLCSPPGLSRLGGILTNDSVIGLGIADISTPIDDAGTRYRLRVERRSSYIKKARGYTGHLSWTCGRQVVLGKALRGIPLAVMAVT